MNSENVFAFRSSKCQKVNFQKDVNINIFNNLYIKNAVFGVNFRNRKYWLYKTESVIQHFYLVIDKQPTVTLELILEEVQAT